MDFFCYLDCRYVQVLSTYMMTDLKVLFLLKDYFILFFTERRREGERQRNINVWLPLMCPLLGTWPATQSCSLDWELYQRPFGSQASIQSTEPHQPGQKKKYLSRILKKTTNNKVPFSVPIMFQIAVEALYLLSTQR